MEGQSSNYVLYYNPYSICSLMVLYTLKQKGAPKDTKDEINVDKKLVDIFHEEQLEEHFLCNINDHGQVPVLTHATHLDAPIADSLEITFWLASRYPDLMPTKHEAEIRQYLVDLHALNYFSLSFPGRAHVAERFEAAVNRKLANPDIPHRYRKALELKLGVIKRDKSGGLVPAVTVENEKNARKLLASLEERFIGPESWIFGSQPTALDVHLVVFIARMTDVGRDNLVPEKLKSYGKWAMQKSEWVELMEGRKTMIPR